MMDQNFIFYFLVMRIRCAKSVQEVSRRIGPDQNAVNSITYLVAFYFHAISETLRGFSAAHLIASSLNPSAAPEQVLS